MRILITGANSFVGRSFLKFSKFKQADEVCLIKNRPEDIHFEAIDVILHVAAIVHQSSKISEENYFRINRDLCVEVAKQAKKQGVKQFVFLSTVKVYGEYEPAKGTWNEKAACQPDDPYGKSKYEAEIALKELEDENFAVSIVRTPLVYGEGVKANMLSIVKLVDTFPILPLGKVNNKRSFTAIENLVALIDTLIEKKATGVFIAMDEQPLSTTELVKLIAHSLNKRIYLFALPAWLIKMGKKILPKIFDRLYGSFEMDNELTRKTIGFKPVVSSAQGLDRMVKYYLLNKK